MKLIQVLGTGCAKCRKLEEMTRQAAREIKLDCEIMKVTDINAIVNMGVLMTPGLAVDGVVVASGRVPSLEEIKKLIA